MSKADAALSESLVSLPPRSSLVVAYSGGLDSSCLLHAAARLARVEQRSLRALHINHGINTRAGQWQQHCQQVCGELDIRLDTVAVQLPGDASEDAARQARFSAFVAQLGKDEVLLLAQHLDDQLETLLLRLLRGAGPGGLGGMPTRRPLGEGELLRPWLDLPRSELEDYAAAHGLSWVEDDSNASNRFDRNYCRNEVLPLVNQRWPEYRKSWLKSQTLLRESDQLATDLAGLDMAQVAGDKPGIVRLEPLRPLSKPRQRNVLRYWLQQVLGLPQVNWQVLRRLTDDIVRPDSGDAALLEVGDYRLQVFQQQLFALHGAAWQPPADNFWQAREQASLALPGNGRLSARSATGTGLARSSAGEMQIRFRQGGETLQLPGRPGKPLKKIFHEQGIPPWLRERVPLLYIADELVCVPGVGVASSHAAHAGEPGLLLQWQHPELVVTSRSRQPGGSSLSES